MKRRAFVKAAATGSAAAVLAAPAVVRGQAQVRWRLASSYPKSLDTIFVAADTVAKRVATVTGGKFEIRVFARSLPSPDRPPALTRVIGDAQNAPA